MDKANAYIKSSFYNMGYVTRADVLAQARCFTYLDSALAQIQAELDAASSPDNADAHPHQTTPQEELNILDNQKTVLQSSRNLMASFKESYVLKKAEKFWEHWDKCKKVAFEMKEGMDKSKEEFEDRVNELEQGRYLK